MLADLILPNTRLYTRKHQIMYDLLLEAKQLYEAELETRVIVYNLDQVSSSP